eukprot:jgi/Chrzof1/334/Cz01g11230.t1
MKTLGGLRSKGCPGQRAAMHDRFASLNSRHRCMVVRKPYVIAKATKDHGNQEEHWMSKQQPYSQASESIAPSNDPSDTMSCCLEHIRDGDLDGLLEFVRDEVIDKVLAWRKFSGRTKRLQFADVLQANNQDLLYLDTYALRNLVFAPPTSMQLLSAMHVTPEKYLQRYSVVSSYGEECVLTFTLCLQETLESQYRGAPLLSHKWMLQSVVGECSSDALPAHPSPSFPPEAVVEAQIQALRCQKVASVFAHASPENKAATGPVERFVAMLHNPVYAPLVNHMHSETVQRLQPSETTYMEVVRVTPQPGSPGGSAPMLYMWIVSRQGEGSNWHNCWMTDAVQLVQMDHLPV